LITSKYQHYLRPDLPMMGHLAASYQWVVSSFRGIEFPE
jgi:hypothetical protein